MNCPECHFDNPDSHRFCGMCGALIVAKPSAETAEVEAQPAPPADEPATNEGTVENGRRPFIVQSTVHDTTSQVTRVPVPPTVGGSTHSTYAPLNLRSEAEDIAFRNEPLAQPAAPVDPEDEPLFSKEEEEEPAIHVVKTPEQREREEWARLAEAEREQYLPPVNAPVMETRETAHAEEPPVEEHVEPVPPRYREQTYSTPVSGSMLGLSAPMGEAAHSEETYAEEPSYTESLANPLHEPVEPEAGSKSFFQFDEPEARGTTDVSGPSFLGLGGAEPDYLLEEQPPSSHMRRNLLFLVLAVFAVLGVLEWRASSNGESTNPMDVLHIKLPKKKGQGSAEVTPATNAPASPTAAADNTPANNGKPDMIAEPPHPAAQAATPPPANTESQTASNATPSEAAASANAPATGLNDGVPAKTAAKGTQKAAPAVETATATPPDNPPVNTPVPSKKTAEAKPPAPAKPTAAAKKPVETAAVTKKPAKPSASEESTPAGGDASLTAGGFELHKGVAAGPTAEGRTWLWRAMSKGNGQAPVLLADMYAQGRGVTKDCEQAVLLLKAASKKPNPAARAKLATMYSTGQCLPKDRVEAYRWTHAALQANPGSEWLEKNQETLWQEMTSAERKRASIFR